MHSTIFGGSIKVAAPCRQLPGTLERNGDWSVTPASSAHHDTLRTLLAV